jgi:hypothetical protein
MNTTILFLQSTVAGSGIEYAWGASKRIYHANSERRDNIKRATKQQRKHVTEAMHAVKISSARAFARRVDEIKQTYRNHNASNGEGLSAMTLAAIQKGKAESKRHRDCGRSAAMFIAEVMNKFKVEGAV